MREISNLELRALAKELENSLKGARLQKFYELGNNEFRFEFHSPGKGTLDLSLDLKMRANATKYIRPAPTEPTQFAMQLRKRLEGAIAEKVGQLGFDRILVFSFKSKDASFSLIAEMFSNGNLILTGEDGKILACYRAEEWSTRSIKRGLKYVPPTSTKASPYELSADSLKQLLNEKKLIACLAAKINLGSSYLEEAVDRAGLELNKQADKLTADEVSALASSFAEILAQAENPLPILYLKEGKPVDYSITPLAKYAEAETKQFASFSQLLDEAFAQSEVPKPKLADEKFAEEKKKLEHTLNSQREAVESLRKRSEEAKLAGDKIYERFTEVDELLRLVRDSRKAGKTWEEIESTLNGRAKPNREKGTIAVEL